MKGSRTANMDLLRIVCMMMVVSMHYFGWGGINGSAANLTPLNFLSSASISVFCRVAVNCFFMLSGFFLTVCEGGGTFRETFQKLFKLWFKVFCYSFFISIIFLAAGKVELKSVINGFFPIMKNSYWFITVFLLITSIRPLLAKALTSMSDTEIISILVFLGFFDCIQAIFGSNAFHEYGTGFLHAFFCVVLGYSIKVLPMFDIGKFKALLLYVVCCCVAGGIALVEKKVWHHNDALALLYNSPLIILASIGFFGFFRKLSFKSSKITSIAPYVLGIYLVNDHPFMRKYFWEDVLHCSAFYDSNWMLLHFFICLIGFVIVGVITDFVLTKISIRLFSRKLT